MPTISVYVTNETFSRIMHNPSKIVQQALREYFQRREEPTNRIQNNATQKQTF